MARVLALALEQQAQVPVQFLAQVQALEQALGWRAWALVQALVRLLARALAETLGQRGQGLVWAQALVLRQVWERRLLQRQVC